MLDMSARFFLSPMFVPSGVSMGQSLPKCVLCSLRASKFSCVDESGLTTRCRWLIVSK